MIGAAPVLDLYAGVGLFSVTAAAAARGPVTAVEGDRFVGRAISKRNAQGHDVTREGDAVETFSSARSGRSAR